MNNNTRRNKTKDRNRKSEFRNRRGFCGKRDNRDEWTPRKKFYLDDVGMSEYKYTVKCGVSYTVYTLNETNSFVRALWFTMKAILSGNYSRVFFFKNNPNRKMNGSWK